MHMARHVSTAGSGEESAHPQTAGALLHQIAIFKSGMRKIQRKPVTSDLATTDQNAVASLCEGLKRALSLQVARQPHQATSVGALVHRQTGPYFRLGECNARAYSKPLGYAGDYLTIELIYRNRPAGAGLLGRYVDCWSLNNPSGRAVRSRRQMLASLIRELSNRWTGDGPMPICSLASGPAREVFDVLTSADAPLVHATCLDLDQKAIDYTAELAAQWGVGGHMTIALENVIRLSLGRGRVRVQPQQLVYSMGLIDYLQDKLVVSLLDWTHDHLLPGGTAAFGNFAVGNPDRAFLDHVLQWKLIHRTPGELIELFRRSRFGRTVVDIRKDSTDVQLLALCTKGA